MPRRRTRGCFRHASIALLLFGGGRGPVAPPERTGGNCSKLLEAARTLELLAAVCGPAVCVVALSRKPGRAH
eukprot:4760913-Alexandrium_andersonii.AAC.1